ncbi:MAG: hypothetical protein JW789_01770, partial [Candidatus Aenigmarchaeota archaeon]|nr:hypothetical protein [Candidatus Aenigmarchaeota archaeon]
MKTLAFFMFVLGAVLLVSAVAVQAAANPGHPAEQIDAGTIAGVLTIDDVNMRIGIGTASPQRNFVVQFNDPGTLANTALYNANTNNGNGVVLSFRTDTTGTGATTFREVGGMNTVTTDHNHATRNTNLYFFTDSASTGSTDKIIITGTGNVGIGTMTPATALEIGDGGAIRTDYLDPGSRSSSYEFIRLGNSESFWGGLMHNINSASYGNGNDFTLYSYGNRDIVLYPGSGQTHILGGNVGIGTTSPSAKLHVSGTSTFGGATTFGGTINTDNNWISGDGGAEGIYIADNGNIGLGDSNPGSPLTFRDSLGSKIMLWDGGDDFGYGFGVTGGLLQIFTDTAYDRVGIGYGGRSSSFIETLTVKGDFVGIGTTSPGGRLHVNSGTASETALILQNGHNAYYPDVYGKNNAGSDTLVEFKTGIYNNGGTLYNQNALIQRGSISDDTNAYLTIAGGTSGYTYFSGNVGIGTASPGSRLHVSAGASTNPFTIET